MEKIEKGEQPKLAKHDSNVLDLAFCIDCTGSMGRYIVNARNSIRQICEEICASEKSDLRLALVEYRDHPPQEETFLTKPHDFTGSIKEMKEWLDQCSANGGGDEPEALADGLHEVLKLSWREKSTKICVLISDAPPHGLVSSECECGIDPVQVVRQLGEKGVTLYCVGCEPAIIPYKDFFVAIAYKTGGQYIPLRNANLLSKVIIGGAQEEISLEKLMEDVESEVITQINISGGVVKEDELNKAVYDKLSSKGVQTKNLLLNNSSLEAPNENAIKYSKLTSLTAIKNEFKAKPPAYYSYDGLPSTSFLRLPPPPTAMLYATKRMVEPTLSPKIEATVNDSEADSFNVGIDVINMQQASRLVQKALNRSNLNKE